MSSYCYRHDTNTVVHCTWYETLTIVITCTCCTDTMTRRTLISHSCPTDIYMHHSRILVTQTALLHRLTAQVYMPVWFLYACHMDSRSYYMYYCVMLPYSCYMIVFCYSYGYSRYWTWELLICNMWEFHIYCSHFPLYCSRYIVPVSRYIVLCYQQSSGPVIMLPVSCPVVVLVTLYTWHIRS